VSQAGAILAGKWRMARRTVGSVKNESSLKVVVVSVSAVLLWFGAFGMFLEGFLWLRGFGESLMGMQLGIGDIVMARALSVLALGLFFMLAFSNVLIVFSTLYRSHEMTFFLVAPLPTRTLFHIRLLECVVFSSWALAYLGSPMLLAYGIATGANPIFYATAVAFYPPYVLLPAALGSMVAMGLVWLVPRLPKWTLWAAAAIILAAFFTQARWLLKVSDMMDDALLTTLLDAAGKTQSWLLPSYWTAQGVFAASSGHYGACAFDFLLLVANALMFTWLAGEMAAAVFPAGWSIIQGRGRARIKTPGALILARLDKLLRFLREPGRSLVVKDIRLFWRDVTQWSQFVIFFGIMAIYIANLRNSRMTIHTEAYRSWIICLNIAACSLILSTLTSRFVYPLVSLEGRRLWILGLAPITFRRVVWQKFWLSIATTSSFTVALVVFSCYMLRVELIPFAIAIYSILLTNFAVTGLAVGLGSLYPNFDEDNPARIVSGMGGTLNFVLSIFYIALVVAAQMVVIQWPLIAPYAPGTAFAWMLTGVVAFITILSLAATLTPMTLGLKNLNRMEL